MYPAENMYVHYGAVLEDTPRDNNDALEPGAPSLDRIFGRRRSDRDGVCWPRSIGTGLR